MYVLTNGSHYIKIESGGKAKGTNKLSEATQFTSKESALATINGDVNKSRTFVPALVEEGKVNFKKPKKKKTKAKQRRRHYTEDVRKLVYMRADGICQLCGRKIALEDMTLDHITPLAMNGKDDVENLQCTCLACNQFKGSILPDEFNARISEIFMYQMEKQNGNRLRWKLASGLLKELVSETP